MGNNQVAVVNPRQEADEVLAFCKTLTATERQNFLMILQGARLAKVLTDISKDRPLTTV